MLAAAGFIGLVYTYSIKAVAQDDFVRCLLSLSAVGGGIVDCRSLRCRRSVRKFFPD